MRYSIEPDTWNWTVYEHGVTGINSKTPGEPTKAPVAYCKYLETAATYIYEREARRKAEMLGMLDAFAAARDEVLAVVRGMAPTCAAASSHGTASPVPADNDMPREP